MTWSGRVGFRFDHIGPYFLCNFWVGDFFEFQVKYFGPYPVRHLVGSGQVGIFFQMGWIRFIR